MSINQPNNPTDNERYILLKSALKVLKREEDFESIIKLSSPPVDITTIAPPMSFKGIRVGVLGGGCAGLAAAYELRKLGFDITILEGNKERIGGRIYTYYFNPHMYGELGAMRIPVSHETVWHYINLFNLKTMPFIQDSEDNILYVKDVRIKGLDVEEEIMKYIYPLFDLTPAEQITPLSRIIDMVYNDPIIRMNKFIRQYFLKIEKVYPKEINELDYLNFRKACELIGLSQGAIDMLNCVLGIDRGFFYNSYIEYLRETYSANYSYLYKIENGNVNLPLAFYDSFKTNHSLGNVQFKFGCRVTGIYNKMNNEKVQINYLNYFDNQTYEETFDYVVCAIPFSTLRLVDINPLFSNEKMHAIRMVNYSPSHKTTMICDKRFWKDNFNGLKNLGGRAITDLVVTSVWYPSYEHGTGGVITASYNSGLDTIRLGNLSEPLRIYTINRQLEKIHGLPLGYMDYCIKNYKSINWENDDLTLGAWVTYNPEQNRLFQFPSITPEYNNRVFFAGEHTSPFHAWIQGALQTGMFAANGIATVCKNRFLKA